MKGTIMELKSVKTIDLIAELIMRRDPTGSIGGSVFFEFFPWKKALESPVVITVEKNHHNKLLSHYSAMATSDSETYVHEKAPCVRHQHEGDGTVLPTNPPKVKCVPCKNTYPLHDMHSVHKYEYKYRRPKVYSGFKKVGKQRVHKDEFVETDNRQDSLWDYWSSDPVVG